MERKDRPSALGWWVWSCAAIYYLYQFILRVAPGVIAPDVMIDLNVSEALFGAMASLYSLAYAGVQIPIGLMADRYGTHLILVWGAFCAVLGTFVFSYGSQPWVLMLGRFLVGAGSAVGFLSCVKLATVWFPHRYLSRVNGLTITLGTFGATVGGKPFALMTESMGWRASLWCTGVLGLIIMVLLVTAIRDRRVPLPKKIHEGSKGEYHWLEALRLVARNPVCWGVSVYNLLMYIPLSGFADLWGIPFLTQAHGMGRPAAARICMTLYIGMALGCPFFGWLSEVMKSRRSPMIFGAAISFVFFCFVIFIPQLHPWTLEALLFFAGFFLGCKTLGFTYICELTPHGLNGTSVGFLNTICMLSGLVIQPLIGGILTLMWRGDSINGLRVFGHTEYSFALAAIPISILISVWIMMRLPESYRKDHLEHL